MAVILPGDKQLDPEPSITKKSLRINLNDNIFEYVEFEKIRIDL